VRTRTDLPETTTRVVVLDSPLQVQPQERAREIARATGQTWAAQGDRGWRRVVPSPDPVAILERGVILALIATGAVVVACGGGGVPVVRGADGEFEGVEAVIDKDLGAALLAREADASTLLILTDVEHAVLRYGTPQAEPLREITAGQLRAYQTEGHFASGSMGPKVEAALRFVESGGGRRAIISALEVALDALAGRTGTQVVAG
jgi:carbamate kinase